MHFYPTERLALFIDGANLYATAKALGFDIDYKRLLALFRTKGQLVRALYYTALAEDQEYSSIRPLVDWLDYNGLHDGDQADEGVHRRARPPQDQGQHGHRADRRCHAPGRASGPRRAVHRRRRFPRPGRRPCSMRGRRVSVVSTLQTQPPMVADELRRQADQFIDLADLEEQICRDPATRPVREPRRPPIRGRPVAGARDATLDYPTTRTTSPPPEAWRPALADGRMTRDGGGPGRGPRAIARCAHGSWRFATPTGAPSPAGTMAPSRRSVRQRAPVDRRPGAWPQRRQPHGAAVHRRLRRRPALRDPARVRLRARQLRGARPTTGWRSSTA